MRRGSERKREPEQDTETGGEDSRAEGETDAGGPRTRRETEGGRGSGRAWREHVRGAETLSKTEAWPEGEPPAAALLGVGGWVLGPPLTSRLRWPRPRPSLGLGLPTCTKGMRWHLDPWPVGWHGPGAVLELRRQSCHRYK